MAGKAGPRTAGKGATLGGAPFRRLPSHSLSARHQPTARSLHGFWLVQAGPPTGTRQTKEIPPPARTGLAAVGTCRREEGVANKIGEARAQIKLGPGEKGYQKGIQRAPACGGLRGGPAPQHKGGGRREGPAKGGGRWYALRTGVLGPQSLMRGAGRREGRAGAAKLAGVIGE